MIIGTSFDANWLHNLIVPHMCEIKPLIIQNSLHLTVSRYNTRDSAGYILCSVPLQSLFAS